MPVGQVTLVDGHRFFTDHGYLGRWIVTLPAFTPPVGGDGNLGEINFAVVIPSGPLAGQLCAFYIDNRSPYTAANLDGGVTFDSASPPAWAAFHDSYIVADQSTWDTFTTGAPVAGLDAIVYDGSFATLLDTGFAITVDPASDPAWPDPPIAPPGLDLSSSTQIAAAAITVTVPIDATVGSMLLVGLGIDSPHNYTTDPSALTVDGSAGWSRKAVTGGSGQWGVLWVRKRVFGDPPTFTFRATGATSMTATVVVVPNPDPAFSTFFNVGIIDQSVVPATEMQVTTDVSNQGEAAYWVAFGFTFGLTDGGLRSDAGAMLQQPFLTDDQRQSVAAIPVGDVPAHPLYFRGVTSGATRRVIYAFIPVKPALTGTALWVAGGFDSTGPRLYWSPDGDGWAPGYPDMFTGFGGVQDLCFGTTFWLAAGEGGPGASCLIARSVDGKRWVPVATPADGTSCSIGGLTYDGTNFIAAFDTPFVDGAGKRWYIMTSPDGDNWTLRDTPIVGSGSFLYKIENNTQVVLAFGSMEEPRFSFVSSIVMASTDHGLTWALRDLSSLAHPVTFINDGFWTGTAWLLGAYPAGVGPGPGILRTTNPLGVGWTNISSPHDSTHTNAFAKQGNTILGVGQSADLIKSVDDGLTWSPVDPAVAGWDGGNEITYGLGRWFEAGPPAIRSADGAAWVKAGLPTTLFSNIIRGAVPYARPPRVRTARASSARLKRIH